VSRIGLTLAAGLALTAIALGVTLSGSPIETLRANSTGLPQEFGETNSDAAACQAGEGLPAGTSAIRIGLKSTIGPRVSLTASSAGRILTSGAAGSGWTGASVTIPVKPVARTSLQARICFKLGPTEESVGILGLRTGPAVAARSPQGQVLPGRFKIEYLRRAPGSWWSAAPAVARRLGLGRAPSGTWIALLIVVLMGAVLAGAVWLTREQLQ
jgi:hypothetical protein